MSRIAVVGAGPVGLATADQLSLAGKNVLLVCPRRDAMRSGGRIPIRETFHAAAAFWTPFSSGVPPAEEEKYSAGTLAFYRRLRDANLTAAGVQWRTVEQYWQEETLLSKPSWRTLEGLNFREQPFGPGFESAPGVNFRWRCEFSYSAPVIQVDVFRAWYLDELRKRSNIKVVENWSFPLANNGSSEQTTEGDQAWTKLFKDEHVSAIVICTGAGSSYFGLASSLGFPAGTVAFKKGVVARMPAKPARDESVLMFEGGAFKGDTLYLIPHADVYVLGGTVHPAHAEYHDLDWQVAQSESDGILERARMYLPPTYKAKLENAGLWKGAVEWRVGVRPVLTHGPFVGEAPSLANDFAQRFGRTIPTYMHFGHGGSGFTFCQDTARDLLSIMS